VRALGDHPDWRDIPVILLTAKDDIETRAATSGVSEYSTSRSTARAAAPGAQGAKPRAVRLGETAAARQAGRNRRGIVRRPRCPTAVFVQCQGADRAEGSASPASASEGSAWPVWLGYLRGHWLGHIPDLPNS
jgi:hypothetical protein